MYRTLQSQFQFHLVRLKETAYAAMKVTIYVSIPFSTIKSNEQPSQYIKDIMFQFHLVRLKDYRKKEKKSPKHVSIPFSTIKRLTR